jgi:uncharacterized membrane protein required for colicin V production
VAVNIGEFITSLNLVDVLIALFLMGMFVLGYIQGAVRRAVGILTMTFSFFLAAQLQQSLGSYFADHWTQYPQQYSFMLAFLIIFAASFLALSLVVQGTYRKVELFARYPVLDEILGGALGVAEGLLFILFITIAMDGYFLLRLAPDPDELPFFRDLWTAIDGSQFGTALHTTVIPGFIALFGVLLPEAVRAPYNAS